MDPPNPNDYRYRQSQAPVSYSTSATTSATMAALSGYEPSLYSHDQMYHQPQQISYGGSGSTLGHAIPGYPPGYNPVIPSSHLPEQSQGLPMEYVPESERQKQIEKRREQNRLAQQKWRQHNKIKIKDLQEKLEDLKREVEALKGNNEVLKTQQDDLEGQIQTLLRENEELKSGLGSSPVSPTESWAQYGGAEDFSDSYVKRGSASSYSGSHRSH